MISAGQLATLPTRPGAYIYKDKDGRVLYVGKAKSLRTRVRSYFRLNANLDPAKRQMLPQIDKIETIVCDSENEALVLEANLIRRYQPSYNVVLRDDKFYLFIKITREEWPRVYPTRRINKKENARYFGPYSSAAAVRQTLKLLRRIFPYRGEKDSPRDRIFPHSLFAAATDGWQKDPAQYRQNIENIINFLKGDRVAVMGRLKAGMAEAAAAQAYERAALYRNQFQAIQRLEGYQKVMLPRGESFDAVSVATEGSRSAGNIFQVRQGKLLNKHIFLLKHRTGTSPEEILNQFLLQYYSEAQDIPKIVLLPRPLANASDISSLMAQSVREQPVFAVPQRGLKKQLVDMGTLNAKQLLASEEAAFAQDARLAEARRELAEAVNLSGRSLHRIETYDISNIQGAFASGSMVVFIDGKPARGQYRKFRIKQENRPNDYKMLAEVLTRRLSHSDWPRPNLIIVDGGKGQLSAAQKVLAELKIEVPLGALAKQQEELFLPGRPEAVTLPYDSDALYLLQRMRDEAHRFTITYHRLLRSTASAKSILDDIPGIGPKTKKLLLRHFGSVKGIREASLEDLEQVVGKKAAVIKEYI